MAAFRYLRKIGGKTLITAQLAEYLSALTYDDLSFKAIDSSKKAILDLIGVTIAGSTNPSSLIWRQYFGHLRAKEEATVWNPDFPMTDVRYAAGLNAACGHALDLDDVHKASIIHPGVVTIPVALALGEHLQKSGKEVITAIVAGFETGARIGEAIIPSSYWFWHTTGIVGNFAAAVTAGHLLGLNASEMNHCLGTAGSQAAGLWEFMNDGAMSKTLHAAKACMNGILSAELSKLGFTGATRILEGEKGFVKAVAQKYSMEKILDGLGNGMFKVENDCFKPYACCRHAHSAVYAVQLMMEEPGFDINSIKTIEIKTYRNAVNLIDNPNPQTLYAHKFSLQYCVAAALTYGEVTDSVFSAECVAAPKIKRLMEKIIVKEDEAIEAEYEQDTDKWIHNVEIRFTDGTARIKRVEYPLGDERNPMDWNAITAKFCTITSPLLITAKRDAIIDKIQHLEEINNIKGKLFS